MTRKKLSRREAAAYLGVSEDTLNKWACIGRPYLPYFRVGRKAVYDPRDLDAFLERHRVTPGEAASHD